MTSAFDLSQLMLHHGDLTIRRIHVADLAALWLVYSDPEVMSYASDPPFDDPAMIDQFYQSVLAGYESGEYYELAILSGDLAIGTCSVHAIDPAAQQAEIGYLLQRGHVHCALATDPGALHPPRTGSSYGRDRRSEPRITAVGAQTGVSAAAKHSEHVCPAPPTPARPQSVITELAVPLATISLSTNSAWPARRSPWCTIGLIHRE
jgi:hypothetical protein